MTLSIGTTSFGAICIVLTVHLAIVWTEGQFFHIFVLVQQMKLTNWFSAHFSFLSWVSVFCGMWNFEYVSFVQYHMQKKTCIINYTLQNKNFQNCNSQGHFPQN